MKTINKGIFALLLIAVNILLPFSKGAAQNSMSMAPSAGQSAVRKAVCVIYPTTGNSVSGTITFTLTEKGVQVTGDFQGLSKGKHGMHIHEFGDCNSPDGTSAGGHFNPMSMSHAGPMDHMRHMGDMGNIEADDSGKAHVEYVDPMLSFDGANSIIGRSVIVHAKEDDMKTQPTGNSGPRIGCGVIGIGK
jgi:superoxide dismutase, Cu-Zn family